MRKYELIKETETIFEGREIYRIRALKDFSDIKAGDVGGWVCSCNNLSQEGDCWIYDNAKCLDNSRVYGNSMMFDNAIMFGTSVMYDNAVMLNNSIMYGNSMMFDNAKMCDNSKMYDNAVMLNNSIMYGNSKMYDNAVMCGNSKMYDSTEMHDNAKMCDNSEMFDKAVMLNDSKMCDNSEMFDKAVMLNDSKMYDNAKMYNNSRMIDYAILDKDKLLYGSINKSYKKIFQHHCEGGLLTAILTEENEILYSIGCKIGMTKEEFIDRIYNHCKVKGKGLEEYPHRQEYLDIIDIAENYLGEFI